MNERAFLCGNLVKLCSLDLERDLDLWMQWNQNSDFQQLYDWGPSTLLSKQRLKERMEKDAESMYYFSIHNLGDDKIIGTVDLSGINWTARDASLGIGIGEKDFWGKGYGTDAMNLILRFGFESLNLNRIWLTVFEYNERAYRCYERLGFTTEGRQRQVLNRFGKRWDMIFMGILRSEWEAMQVTHDAAAAAEK
jgi:RimJ/RimL family protein N-acetyltransferase